VVVAQREILLDGVACFYKGLSLVILVTRNCTSTVWI